MARHKNQSWNLNDSARSFDEVNAALLMDIRDELQSLNSTMNRIENLARCSNVARGFKSMSQIRLMLEKKWPKKPRKRRKT